MGHGLLVHLGVPRKVGRAVPLAALGLFIELVETRASGLFVVPREDGRTGIRHHTHALGLFRTDELEDSFHIVDLVTTNDVAIAPQ